MHEVAVHLGTHLHAVHTAQRRLSFMPNFELTFELTSRVHDKVVCATQSWRRPQTLKTKSTWLSSSLVLGPNYEKKTKRIKKYTILFIVCSINLFIQINSTIVFGQKIIGRKCSPLKFTESDRVPITVATRNTQWLNESWYLVECVVVTAYWATTKLTHYSFQHPHRLRAILCDLFGKPPLNLKWYDFHRKMQVSMWL